LWKKLKTIRGEKHYWQKKRECPYKSGVLRVARGGSGAKAPPLAARPVTWNGRGRGQVELTDGCYIRGDFEWLPGLNKVPPVSMGYALSVFNNLLSKKIKIPGEVFYLLCSLIKNLEVEDPQRSI